MFTICQYTGEMLDRFLPPLRKSHIQMQKCDAAMLSATINPRFFKTQQQVTSRFLNAYVRHMFDSVNLAREIQRLRSEGEEQLCAALRSTICTEDESFRQPGTPLYKAMMQKATQKAHESCDASMHEAKRKSHQFSQLSQSVLKDQRNNLLMAKVILMAQRYAPQLLQEELSMLQISISPADAFAAKLLDDSETLTNRDNIDVLCFASLAEGIRCIANSQMNHFFQMRKFEKERGISSFNGISSDEIIEQLGLDVSLALKYDMLLERERQSMPHRQPMDYDFSGHSLPDLH